MKAKLPIIIGLTGGIGMGKSTIAKQFADCGVSVLDSDEIVHQLLGKNGKAVAKVAELFPNTLKENQIDRKILGQIDFADKEKLNQLEEILHPLVREAQEEFIQQARKNKENLIILDIPLLFETDSYKICHYTIVATASESVQKQRVLARPNMTEEKFHRIIAQQMPDKEKCSRADFVINTEFGKDKSLEEVKEILAKIKSYENK